MRIAVSSWGYRQAFAEGMTWPSFAEETQAVGADGYEVHFGYLDRDRLGQQYLWVTELAHERGLGISTIIAGNDFAKADPSERAREIARFLDYLAVARLADVWRLNVFTGYHQDGQDPAVERARVVDAYRRVMPVAEELGVVCCLENHSSVVSDIDGLLQLLNDVGSPNLVPNPDPTNVVRGFFRRDPTDDERRQVLDAAARYLPGAGNLHIKIDTFTDGRPDKVPMDEIVAVAKASHYDGWIVLEYCGQGDPRPVHAEAVPYLRALWES
ncbi:MAG: sugar phosphate isomerase/epimerase [Anaerolineae bacterium]|nr:sugar phosphate isomerase/epimerase [Anaerolineae bacterium]